MAVSDYNATADLNTSISGINVAEGCMPSNVNNALRQMMADLKTEHDSVSDSLTSLTTSVSNISSSLTSHKVPKGAIVLWSGSTSDIPTGWALCNGSGGTRDLRNRFIVGAGGEYAVGSTGGAKTVTPSGGVSVSVGGHVLSWNEMPNHNHRVSWGGAHGGSWYNGAGWLTTINARDWPNYNHYCDGAGSNWSHNHGAGGSFSGNAHENRPPFYALCFIQKVV